MGHFLSLFKIAAKQYLGWTLVTLESICNRKVMTNWSKSLKLVQFTEMNETIAVVCDDSKECAGARGEALSMNKYDKYNPLVFAVPIATAISMYNICCRLDLIIMLQFCVLLKRRTFLHINKSNCCSETVPSMDKKIKSIVYSVWNIYMANLATDRAYYQLNPLPYEFQNCTCTLHMPVGG